MDAKSKKVLAQQGSSVAQAFKWIGGAIFGEPDDVLDEMAEMGDEEEDERTRPRNTPPRRPPGAKRRRRVVPPPPPQEVIDVEAFLEDEADEENDP